MNIRLIYLASLAVAVLPRFARGAEENRYYPLGPIGGQYLISSGEAYAKVVSLTTGAPGVTAGLQTGDLILGAFGKAFTPTGSYHFGVSQDLGFAVDRAEGGTGALPLQVLRPGVGGMTITVNLPAAGAFGPAYPRNNAKFAQTYESAVAWLHTTAMNSNGSMGYFTGWTGLALLGHPNWNDTSGAKPYRLSINKIRDSVVSELYNANYAPTESLLLDGTSNPNAKGGISNWQLGQKVMFLAELWAKTHDSSPISATVGGVPGTVTLDQALQRGTEMCANSVQWWKQPAQHSNGYSPEYSRVAGMSSHGGVTGDYMHQGWYCGINMTGVYGYNAMAFARRAGVNMNARPKDGHYFGFSLNPGDAIPASIANALPASITLPQYAEDPVLGLNISNPFWYDPSIHQKFLMRMNFLARRSAWYSLGSNDDGLVGYAPEARTAYDAGGRTPGTLLGMAMYQQDVGGLDAADMDRMERLKGYITRNYMRHQEAHAYCVGAQAYQAMCSSYLSDRQQRYFMDNWRFYFALSRTPTGGFQYFRSRSVADSYLNETHCAAIDAALPYGIANGGFSLIPAYKAARLLARFDHPEMTWPSLAARSLKTAASAVAIPFQIVDGNGQVVDPASYTATWTKLSGAGVVSFGPNTTFADQPVTLFNQNNPPDSTNLPSGGYGNYRGFSFRPNDSALTVVGGSMTAPDLLLGNLSVRRSATAGTGSSAAYLKVYSSATPSTATWVGDSVNTNNTNGGISDANLTYQFNSLPVQAGTTYYCYFANTPGNLDPAAITWVNGRLLASNHAEHTYSSGSPMTSAWAVGSTTHDVLFSASLQMRTYSSPATTSDTLTFAADNTYRVQLTVTDGTNTVVEPIDVVVNTSPPVPPPSTMAFTTHPQPASAPLGGSLSLTVAISGPSPAVYQWRRNGVPIGTATTSPTLTLDNVSGGIQGNYDCLCTTTLGTMTSNSAPVTITGTGGNVPGGLWQELYTAISGETVSNLTSDAKYPLRPDSSGPIASAASTTNYGDSYGQRWTGWITPAASGRYRFYLATDNSSELWLGASDLPSSATRILTLSGYTGEKQWSARSPSAYFDLTAGTRYYLELRHKESSGGDHCALAWQREGEAAPVNGTGEIPGAVLSYRIGGIYDDVPLENIAPAFSADPVAGPKAYDGRSYSGTLAGAALDPNSSSVLTYSLVSGPAWLSVASGGALSGTPATGDIGLNTFTVRVADAGGLTDDATLQILVDHGGNHPPVFTVDPVVCAPGAAMAPYGGSISALALDEDLPVGDTLTFSMTGGPAWLSLAADGTLSGNPALADVGTSTFTLRVTDAQGAEDVVTASLEVGPAHFHYDLNGATAGSGASVGGSWDASAQWTSDPSGQAATFAWADGATPVFSAGADASGDYTVTNSAARVIGGFTARAGRPRVTGGSLETNLAQCLFDVQASALGARVDSPVNGAGGLVKTGPGTLVLAGANTYAGDTSVNQGVLEMVSTGRLYNGAANSTAVVAVNAGATWKMPTYTASALGLLSDHSARRVLNGGGLEVTGSSHTSTLNFTVAEAGGTLKYNPSGQTLTLAGNAGSDLVLNGPLAFQNGAQILVSESIGGPGSISKSGSANLVLSGSNTFTGPVTLSSGNLIFDHVNSENGVPALILNGGTLYLGAGFANGSATFSSLSGPGSINMAYGGTTGTRTVLVQQATDTVYSGVISDASGSRFAGLAKAGAGKLTLTGASTYTGATAVTGGTLRVNGSLGNTATTVASAGVLEGDGSLGGSVSLSGTLAPGDNSVGTISTGALTLAPGSTVAWEIGDWNGSAGTGYDSINAASVNLTATTVNPVTIRLIGASLANFSEVETSFTLVQSAGAITGFDPGKFVVDATALPMPGGSWSVVQSASGLMLVYAPANHNPVFAADPIDLGATEGVAFSGQLLADDEDVGDSLTFGKVSGPVWLSVSASGALGGTPGAGDVGANAFVVSVTDGRVTVQAALNVLVAPANHDGNANGIHDDWETAKFGHASAGANPHDGDPDGDGLTNLMEFALDSHPMVANRSPLVAGFVQLGGASYLRLTVPKNPLAANLDYLVETCGDLSGWTAATTTVESDTEVQQVVRDTLDSNASNRRFIRLRVVVRPQP